MARSHLNSLDLDNSKILQTLTKIVVWKLKLLSRVFSNRSEDILLISLNNIGDTILSLHAFRALRKNLPNRKIKVLTYNDLRFLFEREPGYSGNSKDYSGNSTGVEKNSSPNEIKDSGPTETINRSNSPVNIEFEIIGVQKSDFRAGLRFPSWELIKKVRKLKCGVVLNFSENPASVFTMLFSGGKKFYGVSREAYKTGYTSYRLKRDTPHLIDIYFDALESFISIDRTKTDRVLPLRKNRGKEIIITPFAGWDEKMWGLKKTIELAFRLSEKHPVNFVVEKGRLTDDVLAMISGKNLRTTELESIGQYLPQLEKAAMMIANDTGPIHLAAWFGLPTVAIFGPTNPLFCKQPGDHHIAIMKKLDCSPTRFNYCYLDAGRSCPHRECLTRITVEEVEKAALDHLSKYG
ncbi:MAG: glycosyltransferase family 9 protein [Ignavibacteriales bacterium]|nr:MAG: glycosyltransferase family 9 protein [Ignavibacteriaceae bacterium]MBW7872932.1 glycosyltransferase family 9 protein [Ignavibacteria bacterium]MCZ2142439.1 glycosyltransferase family 9 protein [Ignavibacteriales bacterium]MBV6445321.1 hypothetical protein [Ignavibacteriaceae bacterium]MBZ0196865.1 glycosyltransferase family 9 protein [Ignavibacteriaceae bacterium]